MKLFGRKRRREEIQNQSRVVRHRQQAWQHFEGGDYLSARVEFAQWGALEPMSAAAWFGLGWCNLVVLSKEGGVGDLKVINTCESMFEKAIRLNEVSGELTPPQLSATHLQLGWAHAFRKDIQKATAHFTMAVEAAPESGTSADARNELACYAMEGGDSVTAERLLRKALEIDPQHKMATNNLTKVLQRVEGIEIVFIAWFPLPGVKTAVWVHPDETLGEIAARVFSEHSLPYTAGTFLYSGDEALPHFLDSGYREGNETIRALGVKERDTIIYTQLVKALGTSWEADFDVRVATKHLNEGRPALARREIASSLKSIKQTLQDVELEAVEGKINAFLKLDPDNVEAHSLSEQVHQAMRERDRRSATADGASWTHSHGGPTRTSQTVSGPMPPLQPVWEFVLKDYHLNSPVVGHGRVYVTSWDGHLYCVDGETGQEHWRWTANTIFQQSPVVGNRTVYAVDRTALYCLDARTGELCWLHESADLRSPALSNDKIYIADKEGVLSCINANTGQLIKKVETGELNLNALLVDDMRVFAASHQALLCADFVEDRLLWKRDGRFDDAVPVLANGNIYIGTFAEGIMCIDANNGRIAWLFSTEARVRAAPAAGRGRIFFGDTAGRFGCLDACTGELLWTPREGMNNQIACSTAPVIADSCVYVHLDNGILYCLDTMTGVERWRGPTQEWQSAVDSLAVTAAAIYYVNRNGVLGCMSEVNLCAGTNTPPAVTPHRLSTNLPPVKNDESESKVTLRDYGRPTSLSHQETDELHQALFFLRANHLDDCIAILRRLERDHPNEGIVLHNLGVAYEWQGLIGDALSTFDRLLDAYPDDAHAFAALGRLLRTHPDIIQAIYGSPSAFHQPLKTIPLLQQGLTTAVIAGEAAVLVKVDGALAANFGESPAWYWWQLVKTSHYPVLRFYLEFDYQPYRAHQLLLPLDIAEPSAKVWLELLQAQTGLNIHLYDLADEYLISTRLNVSEEQHARICSLCERARDALSEMPTISQDFEAAVIEAETIWNKATRLVDRATSEE